MSMSKAGKTTPKPPAPEAAPPERRGFLAQASAVVVGGIVTLFPFASGLAVFLDPLRSKPTKSGGSSNPGEDSAEKYIPVATLDEVPDDGIPRQFPVITDLTDAWTFYPDEPIGAVYLRREPGEAAPKAVSAVCPHLGCFVDFNNGSGAYKCPCHDSSFEPNGERINPDKCPAPRSLDELQVRVEEVDIEGQKIMQVQVKYQKFHAGKAQKIPEA
jgi:Rieske Fe-S protein